MNNEETKPKTSKLVTETLAVSGKRNIDSVSPTVSPSVTVHNRFSALSDIETSDNIVGTPRKRRTTRNVSSSQPLATEIVSQDTRRNTTTISMTSPPPQTDNMADNNEDAESIVDILDLQTTQSEANKLIHETTTVKQNWRLSSITPDAETIIIGDSNMRLAVDIKSGFELHVYPGCKLNHVEQLLRTSVLNSSVKNILVAVGINNRGTQSQHVTSQLRNIVDICRLMNKPCHFLGVSSSGLSNKDLQNIRSMNQSAHGILADRYIEPLESTDVKINPADRYRIHHEVVTVNKILNQIYEHFL